MRSLRRYVAVLVVGVAIAIGVTFLSPWASSAPDGLEKVAEQHEFLDRAAGPHFNLIPDYQFPGVRDERIATVLAGATGVLAIVAITVGAGMLLARKSPHDGEPRRDAGH